VSDEEEPKKRREKNLISNDDFPEVQYKDADGNTITTERELAEMEQNTS